MRKTIMLLLILMFCVYIDDIEAINISFDSDSVVMSYTGKEFVIESFKSNDNTSVEPISATLLSGKALKEQNVVNIKEITSLVPNLFIPDYGSKMTSPAYIRGIGSRINAPSVGLYVDGIPYFDRSTFDFNLNEVESIEVLRGPQGTIYGRNAMGGVINVYTKSPFKYNETNVKLSAGNYNTYETSASHYGSVNDKFGYAVSGNYAHTGGYFKNTFTGEKADPMDAVSGRIRLIWRLLPRLSINLTSAYEYSDQYGYPYRLYDQKTKEIHEVNYNAPSFYKRNMSTNGLNVEYITDQFKLGSQTSFQYFDGKQGLDQDFSPQDLYFVDYFHRQQMFSQEFNIKSIGSHNYKWQFGLFGFHQNYYTNNNVNNRIANTHSIRSTRNPSTGVALYHQSTIDNLFTRNFSLILGLRYDWEETKLKTNAIKDRTTFSQVTPKASLQYSFDKQQLIYASVTKGYKTGGFNTLADRDNDRIFKPEHSWSYELGFKSNSWSKFIQTDISLFYIRWNDQQISQKKSPTEGYLLRNAGRSESKGVEITTTIIPTTDLNFLLTYGYTNAKFKDYEYNLIDKIRYDNNRLPMVPQNTFSVAANYTIRLGNKWLDTILLHGQYSGIGKLYWNDENSVDQPYYSTFDGKISFAKKQFSVDFWAKNIGNTKYIAYYFTALKKDFVQQGKPFRCGVNLNLTF